MRRVTPSVQRTICRSILLFAALGAADAAGETISKEGVINFNVNFVTPPSPQTVALIEGELERSNIGLCDATDGQLRFGKIRLTAGHTSEDSSEIFILPQSGRAYAADGQVFLSQNNWYAETITHELGHSILGLGEQYEEQQRKGTGCGIGLGFDPDVRLDATWNSIMQQAEKSVCQTAAGKSFSFFDPGYWSAEYCRDPSDCQGVCTAANCPTAGFTCSTVPTLSSELSVSLNHDIRRGSGASGCPDAQPGRILYVDARLSPTQAADFPGPGMGGRGCGDGLIGTGEMCDGNALGGKTCSNLGFGFGSLQCYANCALDTSGCSGLPTCGDGFPQTGEACEAPYLPSGTTCTSAGFSSNAPLTCDTNCGINYSQCPGVINTEALFDPSTLITAKATADASYQVRFIDELGKVGSVSAPGPSLHAVHLFLSRSSLASWNLYVYGADEEYAGGAEGGLRPIAQISLGFFPNGVLKSVNGVNGATEATIELGGSATGAFAKSAAGPAELKVDVGSLQMEIWRTPRNSLGGTRFGSGTAIYAAVKGSPGAQQLGKCEDEPLCKASWNEDTGRYELTHQSYDRGPLIGKPITSDWDYARLFLKKKGFDLVVPRQFPEPAPLNAAVCSADLDIDSSGITHPDQIMVVLDSSGSMNQAVETSGGQGRSRLEYVQDAAKAFAALQEGKGTEIGFISFNSIVTPRIGLAEINNACGGSTPSKCGNRCVNSSENPNNCGSCGTECQSAQVCSSGTCQSACAGSRTSCQRSCVDLTSNARHCGACGTLCPSGEACVNSACVATGTPVPGPSETVARHNQLIDNLEADGQTAIGDALRLAQAKLHPQSGLRAIVLMSDGQSNIGEDPATVVKDLVAEGIELYLVPTGPEADRELAAESLEAAPESGLAEIYDAPAGDEAPAAFVEAFARSRSEALVLGRTFSAVAAGPEVVRRTVIQGPSDGTGGLPTSETFIIPVEDFAARLNVLVSSRNAAEDIWAPILRLRNPSGQIVATDSSSGVAIGQLVKLLQVDGPAPGDWKLEIFAGSQIPQRSMLLAHIQNPNPDCRVSVSPERAQPGEKVRVTAHAFWGNQWISAGVGFRATIRSPDGSELSLALKTSEDSLDGAYADFYADANSGIHQILVSCDVRSGAVFGSGESTADESEPLAPNPGVVKPFYREGTVSLPVGQLGSCSLAPSSVACCSSLSSCPGTSRIAIMTGLNGGGGGGSGSGSGSGQGAGLTLDDRASLTGVNGAPTEVLAVGSTRTELGADSVIIGSLASVSNIFARERAHVTGAGVTSGSYEQQNQVRIDGGITQGVALTIPASTLVSPQFPSANRGPRNLEPDARLAITPGAYGNVTVKSRAILQLEAGTYWFESFEIEPQAVVRTSGTAPTRIFVRGNVAFKETPRHISNKHDKVLVFALTSSTIFLEKALSGTIIAPYANVVLGGSGGTVHQGSVFARGVQLRSGVRLEHYGFPWTWVPGGVPPVMARLAPSDDGDVNAPVGEVGFGCSFPGKPADFPSAWLLLAPIGFWLRRRRNQAA